MLVHVLEVRVMDLAIGIHLECALTFQKSLSLIYHIFVSSHEELKITAPSSIQY